eukprot:Gb_23190 [translate_table: standard]
MTDMSKIAEMVDHQKRPDGGSMMTRYKKNIVNVSIEWNPAPVDVCQKLSVLRHFLGIMFGAACRLHAQIFVVG